MTDGSTGELEPVGEARLKTGAATEPAKVARETAIRNAGITVLIDRIERIVIQANTEGQVRE